MLKSADRISKAHTWTLKDANAYSCYLRFYSWTSPQRPLWVEKKVAVVERFNLNKSHCSYITGNFFLTARALIDYFEVTWHWSYYRTVSQQNLWAGIIAQSMTSEGNSALLPAIVDRRPPLQRGGLNSRTLKATKLLGQRGKACFVLNLFLLFFLLK